MAPFAAAAQTDKIGRYRIVKLVGAGGMGAVYQAMASGIGGVEKRVALKVIKPELAGSNRFVEMFVEEMKLALSLSHTNIVQAFDVGRIDDGYFMAMEYVHGVDLAKVASACVRELRQPIPQRYSLFMIVEALKGLDFAHRCLGADGMALGIVHRDISPGNILVSFEGEVKLTDFGVAKSALAAADTAPGSIVGKFAYMAPEQLRGEALDRRADVYSMGIVLFEMLTGRRAFTGDQGDVIARVLEGKVPPPRQVVPEISPELDRIVLRATAQKREERYATAAAMRQDIETYAMRSGYLLSSTDVADFLGKLSLHPEPTSGAEPVESATDTVDSDVQKANFAFAELLGAELQSVATQEPMSVFTIRERSAADRPGPTRPELPRALAAKPRLLEEPSAEAETSGVSAKASPAQAPEAVGSAMSAVPPSPSRWRAIAALVIVGLAMTGGYLALETRNHTAPQHSATTPREPREAVVRPSTSEPPPPPPATPPPAAVPIVVPPTAPTPEPPLAQAEPPQASHRSAGKRHRPAKQSAPPSTQAASHPSRAASLSVNSSPWAYVEIDGVRVGETPLVGLSISPGVHRIQLTHPPRSLSRTLTITVRDGEHRRIIETL